jgi:O-antigen/teichoic acid export membrane protein
MSIFVYFFSESIGALLNINQEYRWLLVVSSVMTIGSILDGHLDKYFKAKTLVNRQIMYLFTRTFAEIVSVIIVFSFLDFPHASSAISAYILIVVFIKLIFYPWLFIDKKLKNKNKIKLANQKTFLNFAYMLVPSILLTWVIVQIDRMILGWMLTPIELGIYAFSATLASYIGIVSYSIMPLFQSLSALYYDKSEFQMLRNLFEIWQYLFLSATTILMIIIVFFSQEILFLTAGEEYSKLPHLLLMLTGAVCLDHFFGQYQLVFNLAEKPKLSTLVNSIKLLFMLIFIPIFVYFF